MSRLLVIIWILHKKKKKKKTGILFSATYANKSTTVAMNYPGTQYQVSPVYVKTAVQELVQETTMTISVKICDVIL